MHRPLEKLIRHAEAHPQPQTQVAHFNEAAGLPWRGGGAGRRRALQRLVSFTLAQPALTPGASAAPQGVGVQAEVVLKSRGRAESLRAQEAMQLLRSRHAAVSPQRRALPLFRRRLLGVRGHVSVQQGALHEAAGAVRAGKDGQREVGEGVPQQGAQGELREVTHSTAQALSAHMAQQVVFDGLRTENTRDTGG